MTAGLVLAAGRSRRMGSNKLSLPWKEGRTVVESVVASARAGGFDPILVVLGAERDQIKAILQDESVEFVDNSELEDADMLGSIKAGLRALGGDVEAVAVIPGDMPRISVATMQALAAGARDHAGAILAPVHGGRKGHPVVIPRRLWGEVLALREGETLRTFLRRHETEILRLEVEDPGIHADLDTPEEYAASR